MIELDNYYDHGARIRVVGVGGGGGNAVNSMIEKRLHGVDFFAINCDLQALEGNKATNKVQIGKNLTRGLGAGADPSIGQRAVEEDREEIARSLAGTDMVFITAGMGGGTGTGGAPVVANIAKSIGALVVGIVTKPFNSEGRKRMSQAEQGIDEMRKHVDTLIVIPNQRLLSIIERTTPLREAFNKANDVLYNATRGISEIITVPGYVNRDFADVRKVMREMGDALMGSGVAAGENRAIEAAQLAISSPLLEGVSIAGAQGVLINITGGPGMSLVEADEAVGVIKDSAGDEAEYLVGYVIDDSLSDEVMVTVIATGFNKRPAGGMRHVKSPSIIDKVPSTVADLHQLDEPAYIRRGVDLPIGTLRTQDEEREKIAKSDPEKPAFLRKIMD